MTLCRLTDPITPSGAKGSVSVSYAEDWNVFHSFCYCVLGQHEERGKRQRSRKGKGRFLEFG